MTDEISIINKAMTELVDECKTSTLISNNTNHYKCTVCPACLNKGNEYYCSRYSFDVISNKIDVVPSYKIQWNFVRILEARLLQ